VVPKDDIPFFMLVEKYWPGDKADIILIASFGLEQSEDPLLNTLGSIVL